MNSLYRQAAELCRTKTPFACATIISQDGSTPRSAGSKMLVTADGIVATIGGGGMEGSVIKAAREQVLADRKPVVLFYDMSAKEAANADFICGGRCEVLIFYGHEDFLPVFEAADEALNGGIPAWLCYIIDSREQAEVPFSMCVNLNGEKLVGEVEENPHFSRNMLLSPLRTSVHGDYVDGVRYISQDVGSAPVLYIFGGGHVSKEVARLAVGVGFNVTVIDDREEYANNTRFPDCRCMVVDFNNMPDIQVDESSYLIIMTRGHSFDREVLKWALKKDVRYLGMIGSKSKRDTTYKKLEQEGFSMEKMLAVKCPIGLTIGAETPAEIAVSIMAEIIAERRSKR